MEVLVIFAAYHVKLGQNLLMTLEISPSRIPLQIYLFSTECKNTGTEVIAAPHCIQHPAAPVLEAQSSTLFQPLSLIYLLPLPLRMAGSPLLTLAFLSMSHHPRQTPLRQKNYRLFMPVTPRSHPDYLPNCPPPSLVLPHRAPKGRDQDLSVMPS